MPSQQVSSPKKITIKNISPCGFIIIATLATHSLSLCGKVKLLSCCWARCPLDAARPNEHTVVADSEYTIVYTTARAPTHGDNQSGSSLLMRRL